MTEAKSKAGATVATASKKEAVLVALEKNLGNVTLATKAVGVDRSTFYRWCEADTEYKAKVEALNEVALDFAESMLMKRMQAEDTTAIIFYLKTKGKKRGYVERQELDTHIEMPNFSFEDN